MFAALEQLCARFDTIDELLDVLPGATENKAAAEADKGAADKAAAEAKVDMPPDKAAADVKDLLADSKAEPESKAQTDSKPEEDSKAEMGATAGAAALQGAHLRNRTALDDALTEDAPATDQREASDAAALLIATSPPTVGSDARTAAPTAGPPAAQAEAAIKPLPRLDEAIASFRASADKPIDRSIAFVQRQASGG